MGADFLWRRHAARIVSSWNPSCILDLATGSGDLARVLLHECPGAQVVGADFCLPMLIEARRKGLAPLFVADGMQLPFRSGVFDAVTIAFGLRNIASRETALEEMHRVIRPGGHVLIMDFSLPEQPFLRTSYRAYLHHILPRLAGAVTGNMKAYQYLGESIEAFPRGNKMTALIEGCGFETARNLPLWQGIVAIYTARKPQA